LFSISCLEGLSLDKDVFGDSASSRFRVTHITQQSLNDIFPNTSPLSRATIERTGLGAYVKSAAEAHVAGDYNSVFDDDSNTKKIIMVDERDVGMEMGRLGSTNGRQT
jgi:hypothetical protein